MLPFVQTSKSIPFHLSFYFYMYLYCTTIVCKYDFESETKIKKKHLLSNILKSCSNFSSVNVTKRAMQDVSCSAMNKGVGMEGGSGIAFNRGLS